MKIAIVGTVGIGKTTLINKLKEKFSSNNIKASFYIEEEKYSYLEMAYKDMKKWAYIMQNDFLALRLRTLYSSFQKNNEVDVFDRTYIDDFIYAKASYERGEITEEEFKVYKFNFDKFASLTILENKNYDAIIILKEPEKGTASKRRDKRDRFIESELNHFLDFDEAYESEWFFKHCKKYVEEVFYIIANNPEEMSEKVLNFIKSKSS